MSRDRRDRGADLLTILIAAIAVCLLTWFMWATFPTTP